MRLTTWRKRNRIPTNRHLAAKAMQYSYARYWYDESRKALYNHIGDRIDIDQAILFIAACSPRNTIQMNLRYALREIDNYINNWPPENEFGIATPVIYHNIIRARNYEPLQGLKTCTFASALMGNPNAIVLDTWMTRAFNRRSVQSGEIKHIPVIIRKIATMVKMTPAQTQACLWTYAKVELNSGSHKETENFSKYFTRG